MFFICQNENPRLNLDEVNLVFKVFKMDITAINRSDLMQQFSEKYALDPREAETIVRIILEAMSKSLIKGERIEIRGFGSFELRYRKPRQARNPKSGVVVQTNGKYSIHFKPGKEMRERVNTSRTIPTADIQSLTKRASSHSASPEHQNQFWNNAQFGNSSDEDDSGGSSWH